MTSTDLPPGSPGPASQGPPPPVTIFPILRVVPLPTSYTTGLTPVLISPDLEIIFHQSGRKVSLPSDLARSIKRTTNRLQQTQHQYLSPTRGAEFFLSSASPILTEVRLVLDITAGEKVASIAKCAHAEAEDRPLLEAYSLSIPLKGPAIIKAKSALGLLRGLTTLEQLVYRSPPSDVGGSGSPPSEIMAACGSLYAPFAPYNISDRPAFGWRGLLLDTSRNWIGLEAIRKLLDTMSFVKLNVFHWHITDSNSWPLDLEDRPELAAAGAYSPSQKFTESDIKGLTDYAGERGIDVLLEVDLPGHTASLAASHPEHIASANILPADPYSNQPPAGQLRFATDATTQWTKGLVEDVVRLMEVAPYVGTGGDEVNEKCMFADPVTRASLKEKGWTLDQALDAFTGEIHEPIHAARKTPVVWQDMVLSHGAMRSISPDTIVHIWQASGDAKKVLDKGFRIVHAPGDYFYLDAGQGGWMATPHGSGHGDYRTWARVMSFDPYAHAGPHKEARDRVLGGQACLWTEQTDENSLECVVWPRTAAVADLFWTGDKAGGGYPRNTVEALPRMHDVRYRMVDRGVRAIPLQPHWCALRPEQSIEGA